MTHPTNPSSRREFIGTVGAGLCAVTRSALAAPLPSGKVVIGRSPDYGTGLTPALERAFDQLGGLGALVKGKTVAIKINMVGTGANRWGALPPEDTWWSNPHFIGAVIHLMDKAGAQRVRILEGSWSTNDPLEEAMLEAGWDPQIIKSAGPRVEFENTNYLGSGKKYSRFMVPDGGHLFKGFDLNHSYEDCDVFVSMTKMKEHATAGVTLSMKNLFGTTPISIYGESAGKDEPNENPQGGRGYMHMGNRQPPKSALPENDPTTPRDAGYRMPRIISDLAAARPIHLAIIDAIHTVAGGEGPWITYGRPVQPKAFIIGTNPVNADAVGMAMMGFDPMVVRGTAPFEYCDSTLLLAQQHGLGSRDLKDFEQIGEKIADVRVDYRKLWGPVPDFRRLRRQPPRAPQS
jgi:uncharacterized protein (DUF362 family)